MSDAQMLTAMSGMAGTETQQSAMMSGIAGTDGTQQSMSAGRSVFYSGNFTNISGTNTSRAGEIRVFVKFPMSGDRVAFWVPPTLPIGGLVKEKKKDAFTSLWGKDAALTDYADCCSAAEKLLQFSDVQYDVMDPPQELARANEMWDSIMQRDVAAFF